MSHRFRVLDGPPTGDPDVYQGVTFSPPADGGYVQYVEPSDPGASHAMQTPFQVGYPHPFDTGGAFSSGAELATDGQGRVRSATTGDVVVAKALEGSSGTDDVAFVVLVSQREL